MRKKILSLLILFLFVSSIIPNSTVYANSNQNDENVIEIGQTPAKVIVTPNINSLCYKGNMTKNLQDSKTQSIAADYYSYEITNINHITYNGFTQITNYGAGPATITYEGSRSFGITCGMSVEVGFEYYVTVSVGFNASASYTITALESYSTNIPAGYKGAIIMRYSQPLKTFNQVKRYLNTVVSTTPGYVYGAPYNTYYALSLISL
ncbi:MAG: hypothetical protein H6Q15_2535 [Bacteroidetes bacterium]|nr:hypothetical protein [Bacteroidota bacterium]MBP1755974.1 hypothetical protein [Bacillota bacterium]